MLTDRLKGEAPEPAGESDIPDDEINEDPVDEDE
jgi:hypothetical protein